MKKSSDNKNVLIFILFIVSLLVFFMKFDLSVNIHIFIGIIGLVISLKKKLGIQIFFFIMTIIFFCVLFLEIFFEIIIYIWGIVCILAFMSFIDFVRKKSYWSIFYILIFLYFSIPLLLYFPVISSDVTCSTACCNAICPKESCDSSTGICDCIYFNENGEEKTIQCPVRYSEEK